MLKITPKQKRNISKILFFAGVWMFFTALFAIIQKGILGNTGVHPTTGVSYSFSDSLITALLAGFLIGLIIGIIEITFVNRLFLKTSFSRKMLLKLVVYFIIFLVVSAFTIMWRSANRFNTSLFDAKVTTAYFNFMKEGFIFFSLFALVTILSALFLAEVNDSLGQNTLRNFLTGKYHIAIEEERIFMFLDMRSSTTIAEKLGHVAYYKLLNQYFIDISEAILQTSGKIYQYAGDEVIVSWSMPNGLKNNNCINCLFFAKQIFRDHTNYYQNKFGLVPEFKAGFHYGKVTVGEIGVLKKEIVYTGDVLNTSARIQGKCNAFGVDILLSEQLTKLLDTSKLNVKKMDVVELRGRNQNIKLYTIA